MIECKVALKMLRTSAEQPYSATILEYHCTPKILSQFFPRIVQAVVLKVTNQIEHCKRATMEKLNMLMHQKGHIAAWLNSFFFKICVALLSSVQQTLTTTLDMKNTITITPIIEVRD